MEGRVCGAAGREAEWSKRNQSYYILLSVRTPNKEANCEEVAICTFSPSPPRQSARLPSLCHSPLFNPAIFCLPDEAIFSQQTYPPHMILAKDGPHYLQIPRKCLKTALFLTRINIKITDLKGKQLYQPRLSRPQPHSNRCSQDRSDSANRLRCFREGRETKWRIGQVVIAPLPARYSRLRPHTSQRQPVPLLPYYCSSSNYHYLIITDIYQYSSKDNAFLNPI